MTQGWEGTAAPTSHCYSWPLLVNHLFFSCGHSILYWFQLDSSTATMSMVQILVSFGLPSSYWKVTWGAVRVNFIFLIYYKIFFRFHFSFLTLFIFSHATFGLIVYFSPNPSNIVSGVSFSSSQIVMSIF